MVRPNVLLVMLDATRADACSCYGAERATTPTLDRLACDGVLYERAISPAPWTLPAVASIFTGLYPGQIDAYENLRLDDAAPTLAQVLAENGYATFGLTSNSWLSADFGLQRGFESMHKQWQLLQTSREINRLVLMLGPQDPSWAKTVAMRLAQGNTVKNLVNAAYVRLVAYRRDVGASRVLRPFSRWVHSQQRPWFAFVHYLEAHLPYRPPLKWAARFAADLQRGKMWMEADQWRAAWRHIAGVELLSRSDLATWRDLYLAEVAYADHHLGSLVDWLERTGRLDDTLVIVVADHGESLGEHGLLNHQYCVYDTLLRVPLVMRYPPLLSAGQRVPHQVQTLDLFKTVLDVAGVKAPSSASKSLIEEGERRPLVVAEYGAPRMPHPRDLARFGLREEQLTRYGKGYRALSDDAHKLILGTDGSTELYAWHDDPAEENDLASQRPDVVIRMKGALERWVEAHSPPQQDEAQEDWDVDLETEMRLRALGYIP